MTVDYTREYSVSPTREEYALSNSVVTQEMLDELFGPGWGIGEVKTVGGFYPLMYYVGPLKEVSTFERRPNRKWWQSKYVLVKRMEPQWDANRSGNTPLLAVRAALWTEDSRLNREARLNEELEEQNAPAREFVGYVLARKRGLIKR